MKKIIILSLLTCGLITVKAQTNVMYDHLYSKEISQNALNNINQKPSVQLLHSTMDMLGGSQNQTTFNGRVNVKSMNYGVKASTVDYLGIEHRDVQVNAARSYQINETSNLGFAVNVSYYSRQMERANNQTETEDIINRQMDYSNIYGGFSVAYSYKNLNIGLSSGDLFNTSLDQSSSWNVYGEYTVDVADSTIALTPLVILNQGYDMDEPIAMFGLNTKLNDFVTTSMGYYTNESVHLGMGLIYKQLSFNYRYRYYNSNYREIVSGQNIIELRYQF